MDPSPSSPSPSGSRSFPSSPSYDVPYSQDTPPSPTIPRGAARALLSQFLTIHSYGTHRARRTSAEQEAQIARFVAGLPKLGPQDVGADDACPICLTPFAELLGMEGKGKGRDVSPNAEEGNAREVSPHAHGVSPTSGSAARSPGRRYGYGSDFVSGSDVLRAEHGSEEVRGGVTKLPGCGHVFCMHDLVEWINNMHGSCPTCRRTYLDIRPRTDSDDESSDGGEYVPERDADEEDSYVLDADDFSEPDWADINNEWADSSGDWAAGDDSIEWEDHPVTDHLSALENNSAIVNYSTIEDYQTAEDETTMDDDVDPAFAVDLEGDAEMTDGEGDWGLTDGSSDIMTSDDADMGSARDDAEMDGEDGVSIMFDMDGYSSSADEDYVPPGDDK